VYRLATVLCAPAIASPKPAARSASDRTRTSKSEFLLCSSQKRSRLLALVMQWQEHTTQLAKAIHALDGIWINQTQKNRPIF